MKINTAVEHAVPENPLRLHSEAFNQHYVYDGPLGISVFPDKTVFRLWAPTALSVKLLLRLPSKHVYHMVKSEKHPGLWERCVYGNLRGKAYRFFLEFINGVTLDSPDPYARACTANGEYSVIYADEDLNPAGWEARRKLDPLEPSEISIYELHIRDMSISPDSGIRQKGKFLGLCEYPTQNSGDLPTGLAYLKTLGVTHLQLLPVFDFGSVDEEGDLSYNAQYNWGYDPDNYMIPEGSYATDPRNPLSRVHELKELIQRLHEEGFRVIMDVVFNHVYQTDASPLQLTVPGYYFRYSGDGQLHNGSWCGNETASEQLMFRRYILDSIRYWTEAYGFDGFRMDLMGLHDTETLRQLRELLDAIDPEILLYGEGWSMGNHPEGVMPADQAHANEMPGVRFFNDAFRNALRGSADEAAFPLSGSLSPERAKHIFDVIQALPGEKSYLYPYQTIPYTECHDEHTLFDKLSLALPSASREEVEERCMLALEIQALSHGLFFVHAGQELCRSKKGIANSYNSPDEVNRFPYERAGSFPRIASLLPQLLEMRRSLRFLCWNDYEKIRSRYELLAAETDLLYYAIHDDGEEYRVAVCFTDSGKKIHNMPDYQLIFHEHQDGRETKGSHDLWLPPRSLSLIRLIP